MTPLEAMQGALAAEHAAVYVYGVVGGRVSRASEPDLAARVEHAYVTHRARRDQLTVMIRRVGGTPVAGAVSYQLPNPCRTLAQLRRAALVTERRCAGVYADLVGSTSRAQRQWGIDALTDAAVRELGFGGTAEAFPGAPEL